MQKSQPERDAVSRPETPITPEEMRDYPGVDLPPANPILEFPACLRGKWGVRAVINPDSWWLYCDDRETPVAEFGPLNREQAQAIAGFLNEAQR
jgi:hypothetical protein